MTPMMPDMDVFAHLTPLINTALLLVLVGTAPLIWLQLRKATPLAMRAEVDRITLDQGTLRRAQKDLEIRIGSLHHEKDQRERDVAAVHARITDLSGSIADRLDSIQKGLSLLACSEENWHKGERPAFCPLHQQACPLNGAKKDEPK